MDHKDATLVWPRQIDFVRHAQSSYNRLRALQQDQPLYRAFEEEFAKNPDSKHTKQLAEQLRAEYQQIAGDSHSEITSEGRQQMKRVGQAMAAKSEKLPDIIFVSPYKRTKQSLAGLISGWPALTKVRIIEEERIREREFGMRILYGDSKVWMALNPEQRRLQELQGEYWYRPPQGENIADVRQRMRSWATALSSRHAGKYVLAMTHHITILAFRANVERMTAEQYLQLYERFTPSNGSLTRYVGQVHASTGLQRLQLKDFSLDLSSTVVGKSSER